MFLKVCKVIAILFVWIGLNFIYGFADYSQPRPPYPDASYWGYYGFTALYSALFCYLLYRQEQETQFCLAWKWLSISFAVWFFWQIYAAFFGISINEKYISTSLFYFNTAAFGFVMLRHTFRNACRWLREMFSRPTKIDEDELPMS